MNPPTRETLSRWLWQGIPLFIGIGILAAFVLRLRFGLALAKLVIPIAVLVGIQVVFYIAMFAVRSRYRLTRDLRAGFIVVGIYSLFIVLAGMYYAGQLGIVGARTFQNNYIEFSVFVGVVICTGVGFFSFVKPKQIP